MSFVQLFTHLMVVVCNYLENSFISRVEASISGAMLSWSWQWELILSSSGVPLVWSWGTLPNNQMPYILPVAWHVGVVPILIQKSIPYQVVLRWVELQSTPWYEPLKQFNATMKMIHFLKIKSLLVGISPEKSDAGGKQ